MTILIPVDFSEVSKTATLYAAKLAISPFDTSIINDWGTYIDSMVWKAYELSVYKWMLIG